MIKILLLLGLVIVAGAAAYAQGTPQSLNMTLFDQLNPVRVDSVGLSASLWGYTAPDGREYACFGSQIGTHIIDITEKPIRQVAYIWGPKNPWREMKVYGNYLYVGTESRDSGAGLQIIDLSGLPDSATLVRTDSTNFILSHTLYIRDHFLLANGTQAEAGANGGTIIMDLEPDPTHPRRVGAVTPYYYHDAWMRNDTLLGAAIRGQGCDIYDVSDKANPKKLTTISYPYSGTHNAEITSDGGFVITSDEVGFTPKTMKVWDIRDIENISKVAEFTPTPLDIVHNVHAVGRYVIAAWYTAGVRIIDMIDPAHPREVGYYDTYPGESGGFNGVWEAYGFFPSGKVIASDRNTGLYVLEFNGATAGSVSGVVRNATTGDPISNVTIMVMPDGTEVKSDALGRYYIGGVNGVEVNLEIDHFGYNPFSRAASLQGDSTNKDIHLVPVEFLSATLSAVNEKGFPISDFVYAVEPYLHSTGSANGSASLLLPRDRPFTVSVGKWGYRNEQVQVTITQPGQQVSVMLRRRYQDDATLDLGWSYDAPDDSATTGRWVRIVPYLGYTASSWIHPPSEPSGNRGGHVFTTGAPLRDAPPQDADVNRGSTTLTSPVMDLTDHVDPEIRYQLWFVHYERDTVLDSLYVQLSNDDGGEWTTVYSEAKGRSGWISRSFRPGHFMPLTSRMRVRFRASDILGSALVHAAIDNFDVEGSGTPAGISPESPEPGEGLSIAVLPNPSHGGITIALRTLAPHDKVKVEIFNLLGERVGLLHDGPLSPGQHHFRTDQRLPSGSYMIHVVDGEGGSWSTGAVVE